MRQNRQDKPPQAKSRDARDKRAEGFIPSVPRLTPCGRTRREFIWQAGGGFVGTALAWMLARDGFSPARAAAATTSPLAIRPPHFAPRAKACISLFNYGGPSQVDLFDPKPELTRRHGQPIPNLDSDPLFKVRNPGTLLASTRKFAKHGQSGVEVSDLFPRLAECVDDMAVIRSCYADSFAHGSGLLQMNTGFVRQGYPALGSWVTYGLGTENENLPAFVVFLDHRGGPIGGAPNWSSGFMPAAFQGTQFRTTGDPLIDLKPPGGVTLAQQRQQLDLLHQLHDEAPGAKAPDGELAARLATYELAFRMQASAPEAVDLAQETAETRALYGLDDAKTEKFGRRCLMARRLIERGVRFVQVYSGGGHLDENWDAHQGVDHNHELHCGETDQPIAALLTDLKRRGLLDETLVVWGGEFGRTPTCEGKRAGRDHNPRGFSMWMAGGGVRGGVAYGATDEFGFAAVQNKVHVHDIHATILHLMGLDHERLTYFHGSREMRLTDVEGRVIEGILA
ncbi:MAG: DUF1501 domain-containing protein [Planctomycetia bacterium]|nr:DUF1501 domain-containing protein [Planctomycetia bacterium]